MFYDHFGPEAAEAIRFADKWELGGVGRERHLFPRGNEIRIGLRVPGGTRIVNAKLEEVMEAARSLDAFERWRYSL